MLSKRSEFILDIIENGKQGTWNDYALKYDFKEGRTANDYWRRFESVHKFKNELEPGVPIPGTSVEESVEEEIKESSYLTPKSELLESREFQEFLAWKSSKEEERTFIPGTYAIMGCTHIPFHNVDFFQSCLELYNDIKPTGLILAGDFMDMNSVSGHEIGIKPLPGITLGYEYQQGNIALDKLEECNNWQVKHYLYGNHCDRFWRHIQKVDTSKYGDALVNPTDALNLVKRGYQVQEKWKEGVVYLGKHLEVTHGENCSQWATQKSMNLFRTSLVFFHTHRLQMFCEGNTAAWNLGWGGDVNSPAFSYATKAMKNSWKNAIGIVTIDEQGGYHVCPIIWHNNRFYYGGKKY